MAKTAKKIGFIGVGQMALALASGFLSKKIIEPSQLFACDIHAPSLERFVKMTKATALDGAHSVVQESDVIFLGVKPFQMDSLLSDLSKRGSVQKLFANRFFITIAAGIQLSTYGKYLGNSTRMARVMPNTPCQVGQAATGICISPAATAEDAELVQMLFDTVGITVSVPETQMDALTGLSGSGPAFVFIMAEALADAGVRAGISRDNAIKLAAQTLKGAAEMILRTGEHPAVLKDRVTSPGGTTIAGIAALEEHGLRAALLAAVKASTERSIELAKQ